MRFHVRYASGTEHDVDLTGTIATLGRDPSCDLVLNDPKCSRRHAVLEGASGALAIRDSGSANGVFVNGRRIDRASLKTGDVVQIGEVFLSVLEDFAERTVMMAAEELDLSPTSSHPPAVGAGDVVTRSADAVPAAGPRPIVPRLPSSADLEAPSLPPPPRPPRAASAPDGPPGAARVAEPPSPVPAPPPPLAAMAAPPPAPLPRLARPPEAIGSPPASPPERAPVVPPARPPQARPRPSVPAPAIAAPPPALSLAPLPRSAPNLARRPMAVTALAGAAAATALLGLVTAFVLALAPPRGFPLPPALAALGTAAIATAAGVLGAGFFIRAPWARAAGIVAAGAGVPTCVLTPVSIATLAYLLREEARIHFLPEAERARLDRAAAARAADDGMDLAFAGAIAGAAALGLMLVVAGLVFASSPASTPAP